MMKIKRAYPLIILSLVFLFNPNINLIDVMPDCVAYILLVFAIGNLSQTVPYLFECKNALMKLALVTILKIPAFAVMYSNMQYGSDIVPLFTLSFAVIEALLLWSAVRNLFLALSYIGERTDCTSVREPFKTAGNRTATPEALEKLTLAFFIIKAILNVLPELMLLTREDSAVKRKMSEAYPAALVIALLVALTVGVIWLRQAIKYAKKLKDSDDFIPSLYLIDSYVRPEASDTDLLLKKLKDSLNLLAVASIFIFDISLQNFGGYNILPHFIYGIILFFSVLNLTDKQKLKKLLTVFTVCFTISSVVNQSLTSRFFSLYQYSDLSYSVAAKSDYVPIKLTAVSEGAFVIAITVITVMVLIGFIKDHTDVSPSDPTYGISNRKVHKKLVKTVVPCMILSIVINLLKCANVFLKENVRILQSAANPDGIITSGAPAMNTAVFLLCIVYVIYSFVMVSTLKEEVRFKYGKE